MNPIKVFLVVICLYNPLFAIGQNRIIDSIRLKMKEPLHDSLKVQCFFRLGLLLKSDSSLAAYKYCTKAIKLAQKIDYKRGLAASYNNMGTVYDEIGENKKAVEYFYKAYQLKREINDTKTLPSTLANIGVIYKRDGDYLNASKFYKMALSYLRKSPNPQLIDNIKYNYGNLYKTAQKNDSALFIYKEVYSSSENRNDTLLLLNTIKQAIYCLNATLNYDSSLTLLNEISHKYGNYISKNKIGFTNILYSNIYVNNNHIDSAGIYLTRITLNKKDSLNKEFMNEFFTINNLYNEKMFEKTRNCSYLKKADFFKNLLVKNLSEMKDQQNSKLFSNMELQSEIEKIENKLSVFKHNEEISRIKSKQQFLLLVISIVAILIISVLSIFVYKKYKTQRKLSHELSIKNIMIETKKREILGSINYAKRIQTAILPPSKLITELLPQSFVLYKPKDIVAGDFYWLEKKGETILFAACDCTGHGVPGAMVSVICNNGLNRSVREYNLTDPGKILDKTREIVIQEFEKSEEEVKDGMDVSLLAFNGNAVKWSGANNPLWLIRNGELIEYKANKQPIGKYADPKPFTTHDIALQKGDALYIFTDGLQDQFGGEKGKKFKASKLKELLHSIQNKSINEQMQIIETAFEQWKGDLEQNDDICLIGIKI